MAPLRGGVHFVRRQIPYNLNIFGGPRDGPAGASSLVDNQPDRRRSPAGSRAMRRVEYYSEVVVFSSQKIAEALTDFITRGSGLRFQQPPHRVVIWKHVETRLFLSESALSAIEALGIRWEVSRTVEPSQLPPDAELLHGDPG